MTLKLLKIVSYALVIAVIILQITNAQYLKSSDFKEPIPSVKINGKHSIDLYTKAGDRIDIKYIIEPIDDYCAKKIDNRYYTFISYLDNVKIKVAVHYKLDGVFYHPTPLDEIGNNYLKIEAQAWDYGIEKIVVNLTGYTPNIPKRYYELEALHIDISNAEPNVLPPVIVKVYNLTAFDNDFKNLEAKLNTLNEDIEFLELKGYDVKEILRDLGILQNNLSIAKDYFTNRNYKSCDEKLSIIESQIYKLIETVIELKANAYYSILSTRLKNISKMLQDINTSLTKIANELNKSNYIMLKNKYEEILEDYRNVEENITTAKSQIELSKYDSAVKILESQEPIIEKLHTNTNKLYKEIKAFSENIVKNNKQKIVIDLTTFQTKLYIFLFFVIAIVVVIALIIVRRRKGKWDELG